MNEETKNKIIVGTILVVVVVGIYLVYRHIGTF